jgi:hypothetical protein
MFDTLGCGPEHFVHVSSSLRYDLIVTAGVILPKSAV